MHLSELTITGFRRLESLKLSFRSGLNVLVGPNNVGKTAIVDALRALLSTTEDGALRVNESDLHIGAGGGKAPHIEFHYVFRSLSLNEEADFLPALKPLPPIAGMPTEYEAHLFIRYSGADFGGRLRPKRWCGDHEENGITSDMLEDLRAIYLPPLRDPASGLRPSRTSQIARLIDRLSVDAEKKDLVDALKTFDIELRKKAPVAKTEEAIKRRHGDMLGGILKQMLSIGLTPPDFQRLAARLALSVENLDVEQNGLGFNNLIYMAVVLSELSLNPDAAYKALIVEEPEAHLHPQMQAVLLQYLQSKETPAKDEKAVQVFVTSHSPNFASIANIDTIGCIHQGGAGVKAFFPRIVAFDKTKKEKLQRYMDVTRAELYFARRIIFVEGAAERFMIDVLANKMGIDLRKHSVSILSAEGLNFDAFIPLFGADALNIPLAVISDSDPQDSDSYPKLESALNLSDAAKSIQALANAFVTPFFALKTFEYDLALYPVNRAVMLAALEEIHPAIAKELRSVVDAAADEDKAKELFTGMFDRGKGKKNVQKGAYGQALAQMVATDGDKFIVPQYIKEAIDFIVKE
jgi:putative ATP-dependent endonuclease of OLD family